tara:strand:- start:388 stop:1284 length:897 start_codon:yes stop_codon:yes gene_type:complete
MKGRWIVNTLMFILLLGGAIFAFTLNDKAPEKSTRYEISNLKLSDFNEININFPGRAKTSFKLSKNGWKMTSPYQTRADEFYVYRILSLLAAKSSEKLSADDLGKYGLDQPRLKITFSSPTLNEEFLFGNYNPITEDQYLFYSGNIFIISGGYSETASYEPLELIDKRPIAAYEEIEEFDFSRLEQWQEVGLKLGVKNNTWSVSGKDLIITQEGIRDWFELAWDSVPSKSLEFYKLDPRIGHKSFDILLKGNKKITFYRIQESPELLLLRKDENLLYHFPGDLGFTMLNPNISKKEEK